MYFGLGYDFQAEPHFQCLILAYLKRAVMLLFTNTNFTVCQGKTEGNFFKFHCILSHKLLHLYF